MSATITMRVYTERDIELVVTYEYLPNNWGEMGWMWGDVTIIGYHANSLADRKEIKTHYDKLNPSTCDRIEKLLDEKDKEFWDKVYELQEDVEYEEAIDKYSDEYYA